MSRRPEWWMNVLRIIWPLTELSARMTQWPVVGRFFRWASLPVFTGKNFNISYIPINESIQGTKNTLIPEIVLTELIRRASHRVIIKRCTCRDHHKCKEHPIEGACILLGDGAGEIDTGVAWHVGVDEAIAHMKRQLNDGLIPMAGRVRMDDFFWGVPNRGRLLTICFCCRCCCTVMRSTQYFPHEAKNSLVKLKGLSFDVDTDKCIGCGDCAEDCFARAITVVEGKAVHSEEKCKGCGRCISICKLKAVNAKVADVDAAAREMIGRIEKIINFE
jgi:ferredoxin